MSSYNIVKEKKEAIDAGNRALNSLSQAYFELKSAGNWGIIDILGGGFFTTIIKHSKMDKARSYIEQAKYDLRNFSRELRDVEGYIDLNINIDDFLTFADFFFDGLVADWLVQSRINNARNQVQEAIRRVEYVMKQLENS